MGWMEAGVIVPWQMYQQYGDVRILEQHYASMVAYMDYLERRAVRYVQPFGGFGDWLAIEPTNSMLTNTAYSAYDALIMEQVAKRLGKDADQRRFRTFYENVKRSFNDLFVNEEGRTFAPTVESIFGKDSQVGMWRLPRRRSWIRRPHTWFLSSSICSMRKTNPWRSGIW